MRLTEPKARTFQYDYDARTERFIGSDGSASEWEKADGMIWSALEMREYLTKKYPQFVGLKYYEKIIEDWGRMCEVEPWRISEANLELLMRLPLLNWDKFEKDYPDIVQRVSLLEETVKQLEKLVRK